MRVFVILATWVAACSTSTAPTPDAEQRESLHILATDDGVLWGITNDATGAHTLLDDSALDAYLNRLADDPERLNAITTATISQAATAVGRIGRAPRYPSWLVFDAASYVGAAANSAPSLKQELVAFEPGHVSLFPIDSDFSDMFRTLGGPWSPALQAYDPALHGSPETFRRLLLTGHGKTAASERGVYQTGYEPLNEGGRAQAAQMGRGLRTMTQAVPIDLTVSSLLTRSLQTAKLALKHFSPKSREFLPLAGFEEVSAGLLGGHHRLNLPEPYRTNAQNAMRDPFHAAPLAPRVEVLHQSLERAHAALARLWRIMQQRDAQNVLIFGHGSIWNQIEVQARASLSELPSISRWHTRQGSDTVVELSNLWAPLTSTRVSVVLLTKDGHFVYPKRASDVMHADTQ